MTEEVLEDTASRVDAGELDTLGVPDADLEGRGVGVDGCVGAPEVLGRGEALVLGVAVRV